MKEIIKLTNKYIITATPLILFTLITSVYFAICVSSGKIINIIFSIFLLVLMAIAFIAGWFNMIKKAIENPEQENANSIIKEFIPGVGEYFISAFGAIFVSFLISTILLTISYYIGIKFIGNPQINTEAFSKALSNTEALKQFLSGLSSEQLVKISMWNMLLLGTTALNWFLVMFYMPALFLEVKNPFIAYFKSLKNLFSRHFIRNTGIYILIFSFYFIISILSALFVSNPLMNFVMSLANFYFICAAALGVFYYYNKTFLTSQIGQNVDTYI